MKLKRILIAVTAAATVLQFASCAKVGGKDPTLSGGAAVSPEMYSYMLNAYYRDYARKNAEYAQALGLDFSKDVREQTYGTGGGSSWYDYISSGFKAELEKTLAAANGAKEEKITLTDEKKSEIEDAVSEYKKDAEACGMKLDDYLEKNFGEGVDLDCVEKCLELEKLARQYEERIAKDAEKLTEKDCEAYFKASPEEMLRYDCIKITVPKDKTEKLMNAYDKESFMTAVREILTEQSFMGDYWTFKDKIDAEAESKLLEGEAKTVGSPLSEWAFAEGRKPFEKYTALQSSGYVTVAMILSAEDKPGAYNRVLYRDDRRLKNAEYIYFDDMAEAKSVFEKYETGVSKKEFASLSEKYGSEKLENADRNTCPSAIRDWLFSSDTEKGAVSLCTSQQGAYIVLCEGDGEIAWVYEAKQTAATDAVNKKLAELMKKYPPEQDDDAVSKTEIIPIK